MKKLLIRGDDLGYSEGVTLGMISAYEKGIVNSMAVMINMPYAKEAILLAKKHKGLCLGLHVNVTNGKALAPIDQIPTLVDENGIFISSRLRREQLAKGETLFNEDEAYLEAKYQIERYIEWVGDIPEYIDFHVLEVPELIHPILRIYKEYHVPVCIYDKCFDHSIHEQSMKQYEYYQHHDDHFENMFINGEYEMKDGFNLLVTHPGFIDYDLYMTSSMIDERLKDYALVTSPSLKQWLQQQDIQIISFRDFI
ncbi:ChbG/HpnK family deacetylase [Candidatus Stoquefichus massiliensis]|uniref:ChbG/HpnK family deacetylase n=1 Tax=Candidatus Stoquefichus massiliensis TaxID=1470350 RepID=UPI000487D2ED|nr:ChbG/HpnK family deacetylase [Candidatus Stoquefichus massiliensis]